MSDTIDLAQEHEAHFRAHALASVSRPDADAEQLVIEGVVCCAECEEPIPQARLAAVPGCTRCAGCQEQEDLRRQFERA